MPQSISTTMVSFVTFNILIISLYIRPVKYELGGISEVGPIPNLYSPMYSYMYGSPFTKMAGALLREHFTVVLKT